MDEPQNGQKLPSILIRPEVMRDLKISANEYMVLETVFILSALNGYCYKTLKPMAKDLALNKTTCHYIIERLLGRGLLNKSAAGLTVSDSYIKAAHVDDNADPSSKIERVRPKVRSKIEPSVQKLNQRSKTTPKYYNKNNNENKSTNVLVDSAKPKTTTGKSYRQMFEELVLALGYDQPGRVKPLDSRIRMLKLRLKQFSYEEILEAAKAIGENPWVQGENPQGRRYATFEFLVRKPEQIDNWRQKADAVEMKNYVDWDWSKDNG
jgi:DNA-binding Lrp family transcriptional regulator